MRTLHDLIDSPVTNPFTIDILAPSASDAAVLAHRLDKLPLVANVLSINSFVPNEQQQKLAQIQDAAILLGPTLTPFNPAAPPGAEQIRAAAKNAVAEITPVLNKTLDPQLAALTQELRRLVIAPDNVVLAVNTALTRFCRRNSTSCARPLARRPVTLQSLPASLARDWVLPDGRARLQVLPKPARALHCRAGPIR